MRKMTEGKDRKKILYLITKGNWGGAQRYVYDLATHLPREKYSVVVAFGEGETLEKKLSESGVRTIKIRSLRRNVNLFLDILGLFAILRLLHKEKPDILHLNSSKAGAFGALAGRLSHVPRIIFTGHGWAWNEDRSFLSKGLIAFIHWFTIIMAHKVITVADRVKSEVDRLPFASAKTVTVYNGVTEIDFLSKNDARNELCFKAREKTWIGTISELHRNKGLDFLVTAFARVAKEKSGIALIVIGEGEERATLENLAQSLGVRDKVYFLGFVTDASRYLKAFDIFTLTSRTEAFPYTILEAGLAQLPIIASAVGGIPEAIVDKETGILINRGDIEKMAQNMRFLMDDGARATVYGQAMRKRVEEFFTIPAMLEKTIVLYV